jgi:hypothetical protein
MKPSILLPVALLVTALTGSASSQDFVLVPDGYTCADVTPDGKIVVGSGDGGVFYWDWQNEDLPTFIGGSYGVAVSDDGLTILGGAEHPAGSGDTFPSIWTQATGWQNLGTLGTCGSNGSPSDLSGDGLVAVGLTWAGCSGQGFRWTAAGGMEGLESLGNGQNRAKVTNDDGSVIGGFAQGDFTRTPAVWAGDTSGFVYDMAATGEVSGFNNDGTVILGEWGGSAFVNDGVNFTLLGSLNSGWSGDATEITEDGSLVAGHDTLQLAKQAWLWNQANGFESMDDLLVSLGILGQPPILTVSGMSDDGNVLVGQSGDLGGFGFSGYIFKFDTDGSWADVGGALAGATGEPALVGSGELLVFAPVALDMSNALPGGQAWLLVGLSALNVPFKGGVLVPNPDVILGPLGVDGAGDVSLSTFWPAGVPGQFTSYYQFWIPDAAGPKGYAASNGVSATTP